MEHNKHESQLLNSSSYTYLPLTKIKERNVVCCGITDVERIKDTNVIVSLVKAHGSLKKGL